MGGSSSKQEEVIVQPEDRLNKDLQDKLNVYNQQFRPQSEMKVVFGSRPGFAGQISYESTVSHLKITLDTPINCGQQPIKVNTNLLSNNEKNPDSVGNDINIIFDKDPKAYYTVIILQDKLLSLLIVDGKELKPFVSFPNGELFPNTWNAGFGQVEILVLKQIGEIQTKNLLKSMNLESIDNLKRDKFDVNVFLNKMGTYIDSMAGYFKYGVCYPYQKR